MVVPSSTFRGVWLHRCNAKCSANIVFPAPPCETKAMLRIYVLYILSQLTEVSWVDFQTD
jgi:hypothetical protein